MPDLAIHDCLDLGSLRRGYRSMMREIEAEPIRTDQRSCLVHMLAQHLTQRGVQQVRCRVVPLRITPRVNRNARSHAPKRNAPTRRADQRRSTIHLFHIVN
jgi:hypothetical protein